MKNLFYIITLAVLVTACGKIDAEKKIIGTWQLQYIYLDDDGNPINLDKAETYTKVDDAQCPLYSLIFTNSNECGLIGQYNNAQYARYTYEVNSNNINILERCEFNAPAVTQHIAQFLGNPIKYKLKNNLLIIGYSITFYPGGDNMVIYGFYKRKN